jgi:hypothetical protein
MVKDIIFGILMLPVIAIWLAGKVAGWILEWAIEVFLDT